MFTTRQLIESAYRISGAKGVGETPTAIETADALELLNGILDNFGMEQAFKPGIITREVTSKTDGTIVVGNDGARIITSITADANSHVANIATAQAHGLQVNTPINLKGTGFLDGLFSVTGITSLNSFTVYTVVSGTSYNGTWKRNSESDAYLIDLAIDPPDQLLNVVDGTTQLTEYPAEEFYMNNGIDNGWYYETALDPYPTLHLDGPRTVTLGFYQPGYRNVGLNVDTDKWQMGMKEAIKWRLASDLAMTNGYPEMATQCLNRFSEVIAKYRRSHKKLMSIVSDSSAPGSRSGRYDISTDTFR